MKTGIKHSCMVVDDERHAIEVLSDYIHASPQLQLVKAYQDPVAALMEAGKEEKYDFIFLDIDMPGLSGLELARSLRSKARFLVFTTAHPKYAVEAFDVRADHFLLKPVSMSKFAVTISKLLTDGKTLQEAPDDHAFFIKSDQKSRLIKVCPETIVAIEGLKNYVVIHTLHQKHIAYLTMKEIEAALLEIGNFIRVHKSFIVSLKHVTEINGRMIRTETGLEAPIGEAYKQALYAFVTQKALISKR